MSSDMKKSTLSGRLRLLTAADFPAAAALGGAAFWAADGSAVASAAPAALVRKVRRVVVLVSCSLIGKCPRKTALQVYDATVADVGGCGVRRVEEIRRASCRE